MAGTNQPTPIRSAFVVIAAIVLTAVTSLAQQATPFSIDNSPLPPPTGFVNDYVGVIDAATKQQLEEKLKTLKETTNPSVEIAVAVIKTTGDRDISEYALATYRGWKIGSKEGDNPGALLVVAIDDRKYFTEVGRDLEDELPDGLVGSLQRQYLVPEFKKGNYGKGISDTIDAYIQTIRDKGNGVVSPTPEQRQTRPGTSRSGGGSSLFCCAIILLVLFLIIISRSRGGRGGGRRGGGGGFGGALPWIIGGVINAAANSGSSSSDWGGSSSGGSDWGGGGGFGGFGGGGDSGGGGAGGSW